MFPVKHYLRCLCGMRPCPQSYHAALRRCREHGVVTAPVYLAEIEVVVSSDPRKTVHGVYIQTNEDERLVLPLWLDDDGDVGGLYDCGCDL